MHCLDSVITTMMSSSVAMATIVLVFIPTAMNTEHVWDSGPQEVCNLETFRAQCPDDSPSVIVAQWAKYGRMHTGRCVQKAFGYLGCDTDVLPQVDRLCSGQKSCHFKVADHLHGMQECPPDLAPFLELQYQCIPVIMPSTQTCRSSTPVRVTSPSGYLASSVTMDTNMGSQDCPWEIQVAPGQRINVTLLNFGRASTPAQDDAVPPQDKTRPRLCYQYAVIKEKEYVRAVTECEGAARTSTAYVSTGNTINISIMTRKNHNVHFLFHYEVIGCPNPSIPSTMSLQREGDAAIVTCNHSNVSWKLLCDNMQWRGHLGNCSAPVDHCSEKGVFGCSKFPYSILLVVAIGVALGVFLGGLLLVCASRYLRRRREDQPPPSDLDYRQDLYSCDPSHKILLSGQSVSDSDTPKTLLRSPSFPHYERTCPGQYPCPQTPDTNFIRGQDCRCSFGMGSAILPGSTVLPRHATIGRHVYESPRLDENRKDNLG